MTAAQLKWFNTALWPNACRAQGWKVTDRALKLRVVGEILGREISSTKEVGATREFDRVKNELLILADPTNLNAAMASVDDGRADQRNRWLHKLTEFDQAYVQKLVMSFSHGQTCRADDLDDRKLKAVVVTLEERARVKPEIRHETREPGHETRDTNHESQAPGDPFKTGETPF
jgi:hypothetical protein